MNNGPAILVLNTNAHKHQLILKGVVGQHQGAKRATNFEPSKWDQSADTGKGSSQDLSNFIPQLQELDV